MIAVTKYKPTINPYISLCEQPAFSSLSAAGLIFSYLFSTPFLSNIMLLSAFLEYVHTVQYESLCRKHLPHD